MTHKAHSFGFYIPNVRTLDIANMWTERSLIWTVCFKILVFISHTFKITWNWDISFRNKVSAINDPLGQAHNTARSDHYSHLKLVFFCAVLKSGAGRTWCMKTVIITTGSDCCRPSGSMLQIKIHLRTRQQRALLYFGSKK